MRPYQYYDVLAVLKGNARGGEAVSQLAHRFKESLIEIGDILPISHNIIEWTQHKEAVQASDELPLHCFEHSNRPVNSHEAI